MVGAGGGAGALGPPATREAREFERRGWRGPGGPQWAAVHPNGLCVIGVGPGHEGLGAAPGLEGGVGAGAGDADLEVRFVAGDGHGALEGVSGKRKRGAPKVARGDPAAWLRPGPGAPEAPAAYGISGRLLELNGRLCGEPELLKEDPFSRGWLAIIGPVKEPEILALRARSVPL